jgi:hypothetical protein
VATRAKHGQSERARRAFIDGAIRRAFWAGRNACIRSIRGDKNDPGEECAALAKAAIDEARCRGMLPAKPTRKRPARGGAK